MVVHVTNNYGICRIIGFITVSYTRTLNYNEIQEVPALFTPDVYKEQSTQQLAKKQNKG
jgi:hypothetical protein